MRSSAQKRMDIEAHMHELQSAIFVPSLWVIEDQFLQLRQGGTGCMASLRHFLSLSPLPPSLSPFLSPSVTSSLSLSLSLFLSLSLDVCMVAFGEPSLSQRFFPFGLGATRQAPPRPRRNARCSAPGWPPRRRSSRSLRRWSPRPGGLKGPSLVFPEEKAVDMSLSFVSFLNT